MIVKIKYDSNGRAKRASKELHEWAQVIISAYGHEMGWTGFVPFVSRITGRHELIVAAIPHQDLGRAYCITFGRMLRTVKHDRFVRPNPMDRLQMAECLKIVAKGPKDNYRDFDLPDLSNS